MKRRSTQGIIAACAVSTAIVVAIAAPGTAGATLSQCAGASIHGKGAQSQENAQLNQWTLRFNTSSNAAACSGSQGSGGKPSVGYHSYAEETDRGVESWGVTLPGGLREEEDEIRFGVENAFIGTDTPLERAPGKEQEEEIESHGEGKVLTIPVLQGAIAIDMHLPAGCERVEGGPAPGRIALKDSTTERVFRGSDTKWSQILNGAKLVGDEECSTKGSSTTIQRVVHNYGSGATDSFMKWLGVIYKQPVEGSSETWDKLAENHEGEVTKWPNETADPVVRVPSEVASTAASTPGAVEYADLSIARAAHSYTSPIGGSGTATFWAEVEGNTVKEEGKTVAVYDDPATNGDVSTKGSANCRDTVYTNGTKKFPPLTSEELWSEVVAAKKQTTYPICYLSYDLSLTNFSTFTKGTKKEGLPFSEAPTEGEVRTVKDYLGYELSTGAGGGQPAIEEEDYSGDPSVGGPTENVLTIAQQGVGKIGF